MADDVTDSDPLASAPKTSDSGHESSDPVHLKTADAGDHVDTIDESIPPKPRENGDTEGLEDIDKNDHEMTALHGDQESAARVGGTESLDNETAAEDTVNECKDDAVSAADAVSAGDAERDEMEVGSPCSAVDPAEAERLLGRSGDAEEAMDTDMADDSVQQEDTAGREEHTPADVLKDEEDDGEEGHCEEEPEVPPAVLESTEVTNKAEEDSGPSEEAKQYCQDEASLESEVGDIDSKGEEDIAKDDSQDVTPVSPKSVDLNDASMKVEQHSRSATPKSEQHSRAATPKSEQDSRAATPKSEQDSRAATPKPEQDSRSATPKPEQDSRSATPKSEQVSRAATPQSEQVSRAATPQSEQVSRAATPQSEQVSRADTPKSEQSSRAVTPKSDQESRSVAEGEDAKSDDSAVRSEKADGPREEVVKQEPGDDTESKDGAKSEAMETDEAEKSATPDSVSQKERETSMETEDSVSNSTCNDEQKNGDKGQGETPRDVLKDYAGDVMDDFLGMFGLDKLDEDEKENLSVSDKFNHSEKEKATPTPPVTETPKSTASTPSTPRSAASTPTQKSSSQKSQADRKAQGKPVQMCIVCKKVDKCKYNIVRNGDIKHLCDDSCFKIFRAKPAQYLRPSAEAAAAKQAAAAAAAAPSSTPPPAQGPSASSTSQVLTAVEKECVVCKQTSAIKSKQFLSWQSMNYCGEACLGKFQQKLSKTCAYCDQEVAESAKAKNCMSLGKEVKHFCQPACLEDFRKRLKLCAYCQTDLSKNPDSFMAPVGKGTGFKDFCTQNCLQKYEDKFFAKDDAAVKTEEGKESPESSGARPRTRSASGLATCAVCGKMSTIKHDVNFEGKLHKLCGDPCYAAFRYANNISVEKCDLCGAACPNGMHVQFEGQQKRFCTILCVNTFKVAKKKLVGCAWCATKKQNFDMIERIDANNKYQLFCSLNCLSLYRVNIQATSNQRVSCDQCRKYVPAQYHLTMSDASVRNFCSYPCVVAFQAQFNQNRGKTATAGRGKAPQQVARQPTQAQTTRTISQTTQQKVLAAQKAKANAAKMPIISNVMSLVPPKTSAPAIKQALNVNNVTIPKKTITQVHQTTTTTQTIQKVMIQPPPAKPVKNKSLLCKPFTQTKATTCRPHTQTKETQTEDGDIEAKKVIIPIPVPIFIPCPAGMYSYPTPVPLPIPVPVPVPCFIPTTKNTSEEIFKHMKEIKEKMPEDPFEAELLMMAEAVAENSDSEEKGDSESPTPDKPPAQKPAEKSKGESSSFNSNTQDSMTVTNVLGEDMLQMALRMATEMTEPADLETSLDTAASKPASEMATDDHENDTQVENKKGRRGQKRSTGGRGSRSRKKAKVDEEPEPETPAPATTATTPGGGTTPQLDASLVLKYTYGVNAWKHWVLQKNQQLEKALKQNHRIKLFKTDILQCTADELNYTLCLFVKEVRKPNGEEYAPDSIYYLCLGIQMYLFENSRVDNIFTDMYYEKFTECLNEVSLRYEPRYAPSGHLICRIEEEHLWECKQLGAHSPHVLLNTLIYFNTRDFSLKCPDEHLRLSFSHIMKHWKKTGTNSICPSPPPSSSSTKTQGRTVYLRYYAPAANTKGNKKKKEKDVAPVYEQAENTDNPLRCPVKLYEFYLSKCPESIRNRNDVFYLVPERSCVPDSPVWYSTSSLGNEAMSKMLNRLRMVKEIQESQHGAFNTGFYT